MTQPPAPARYSFGPFEVDAATGELRRSGLRLRLAGQPFRILMALLGRPGELVTREELRDLVWGESTFVDFEHGLNAAVNKLRRALGDAAEDPKYIETHPGRGYRFIGTLDVAGPVEMPAPKSSRLPDRLTAERAVSPLWWIAAAAICLASIAAWRFYEKAGIPPPWKVTRLTTDAGLSVYSTLSPDGKLVAYSSDQDTPGESDLYVRQVSGGQPIRLTTDGAGNNWPDFSPDGNNIAFRSEKSGGGIYEVPTFGGEARLLAKQGRSPKFSPDGSQLAYWIGDVNVAAVIPGGGEVWVVPVAGGSPRRIGASLTSARYPIWSPDGEHLLLTGYASNKASDSSAIDWWFVDTTTDSAMRTGLYDAIARGGLQSKEGAKVPAATFPSVPAPGCWLAGSNRLIFSARNGDTRNLWETEISPRSGQVSGVFNRLTAGAGDEVQPSCASADALTFTGVEEKLGIWSFPIDLNQGKPASPPEPIRTSVAEREPSLSGDGRHVAYVSAQSGPLNIWMQDLQTKNTVHVANSPLAQRFPAVNRSGTKVAFSAFENGGRSIYVWSADGGTAKVCTTCLRATDWSSDETQLLVFGGSPYRVSVLDVASHRQTPLLAHATYNLLLAKFSPDNRWISFTARTRSNRAMIMVAPLDGVKQVAETAWIPIAEVDAEDRASWSPDGKTLYYTSSRDGHSCLWGQRLDVTHHSLGEAFAVQHFHGRATYQQGGWSSSAGRIAVALDQGSEDIWMMSRGGGDK